MRAKYIPTTHAINRAIVRFGVDSSAVADWYNEVMRQAKYSHTNARGLLEYVTEEGKRILIGSNNAIVTIYDDVRLDFLRPTIEREIRKLRRENTRKVRALERRLAGAYKRLAEQSMNYANARNPQTRAGIYVNIERTEQSINDTKRYITQLKDEGERKISALEVIAE